MMAKKLPAAEKVYDTNNDCVHYEGDAFSGNVTLCGQTDWICQAPPESTTDPVTCEPCKSLIEYFKAHTFN